MNTNFLKSIIFSTMFLFISSCSSNTNIRQIDIPEASFEKTERFKLQGHIEKPGKPELIQLDSNFNITYDNNDTKYFAFVKNEFAKIVVLSNAFDSQKDIIDSLEDLVNVKIDQINSLKELITTNENLSKHIAVLYVNEQEMRQLEQNNYKFQKLMDRIFMIIQGGAIIALAIAL